MNCNSDDWYISIFKSEKSLRRIKSDTELLGYYVCECEKSYNRWNELYTKGGNDPFWSDGTNLNLVRNHIIYYKRNISKLCELSSLKLPKILNRHLPQEVSPNYMANNRKLLTAEKTIEQFVQLSFLF